MTDTAATEMIHSLVPLCVTLGITADTAGPNEVVLSLDWAPNLCTGNDVLHGGIVMALADSSGAVCAFLNLPEGAGGTATIESKTNFFRPLTMRAGTARGGLGQIRSGHRVVQTAAWVPTTETVAYSSAWLMSPWVHSDALTCTASSEASGRISTDDP